MNLWQKATDNWSELCVAMGCTRMRVAGALVHTYPINLSGSFYNCVFVQNPQSFVTKEVENIYAGRMLPFAINLPSLKSYEELGKSLKEQGYSLAPPWTLMTLNHLTGNRNPDVRVQEADESKLGDWFELQDVFPHVDNSRSIRLEMIKKLSTQKSAHFLLASLQGKSVGAGLLFAKDRIDSIHMVATLNEFRRRNVATTVTLEAIHRARKDEADLVWLRTRRSGTGEKVYTKIGFQAFLNIMCYTKTPQFEQTNLPSK